MELFRLQSYNPYPQWDLIAWSGGVSRLAASPSRFWLRGAPLRGRHAPPAPPTPPRARRC
eukprot:6208399-Pleurochrysis_carterae.AAC.1